MLQCTVNLLPQQTVPMIFNPQIAPFRGDLNPYLLHGSLGPCESVRKRHLDRFIIVFVGHMHVINTQTKTLTLHATSVAIGLCNACDAAQIYRPGYNGLNPFVVCVGLG